jgi:hypothetical protein
MNRNGSKQMEENAVISSVSSVANLQILLFWSRASSAARPLCFCRFVLYRQLIMSNALAYGYQNWQIESF